MAIGFLDKEVFTEKLHNQLSPSGPIRTIELLRGRTKQLDQIEQSLYSPGRQVFIYGDRGVGKTSLALTAAYIHQASDDDVILLGCQKYSRLFDLIESMARERLKLGVLYGKSSDLKELGGSIPGLTAKMSTLNESGSVPALKNVNEAISLIKAIFPEEKTRVIVIDEFDQIESSEEREVFADFIKQLGDQEVSTKFIFCGVAQSINDLITAHHSCYRYLGCIELERLGFDARLEIINSSAENLQVNVDRNSAIRIASISDGYPHYVHLLCEKLYWQMFLDDSLISESKPEHFVEAVRQAATDMGPQMQVPYDKATKKYQDDYREVLWAVVDNPHLIRKSSDIYQSYLRIAKILEKEPISRETFNNRMNRLKKESHGEILKGTRQGWYEFRENIIRGYVRLKAEQSGLELDIDHFMQRRTIP